MIRVLLATVAMSAAAWVAAPWLSMWRRGTRDQQTVRSWRNVARRSP